jgi:hypothetical protein
LENEKLNIDNELKNQELFEKQNYKKYLEKRKTVF